MNDATSHTLVIEVRFDRECPHGSITSESGHRREFAGRLGLIGAIDELLTPPDEAVGPPTPVTPSAKEPS